MDGADAPTNCLNLPILLVTDISSNFMLFTDCHLSTIRLNPLSHYRFLGAPMYFTTNTLFAARTQFQLCTLKSVKSRILLVPIHAMAARRFLGAQHIVRPQKVFSYLVYFCMNHTFSDAKHEFSN